MPADVGSNVNECAWRRHMVVGCIKMLDYTLNVIFLSTTFTPHDFLADYIILLMNIHSKVMIVYTPVLME